MCLYPRFIKNKRYTAYKLKKENWGRVVETCEDSRKLYVPIGCGECYECRRQKAQQWRVRLHEELKVNKYAYFTTLTFSNGSLIEISKINNSTEYNYIATTAVRRFLERWRKKHKKSLRHWLVTELGHEGTERIHLHGIIFSDYPLNAEYVQRFWKYGIVDLGEYCNERSVNYIVKYITKIDIDHKTYKSKVLCSAGLGSNYCNSLSAKDTHRYRPNDTKEYYLLNNGMRVALPIYYRNKLFSRSERDQLWTERLDRHEMFVNGIRIRNVDTEKGLEDYKQILVTQQEWNKSVGYGDLSKEWKKEDYYMDFAKLNVVSDGKDKNLT